MEQSSSLPASPTPSAGTPLREATPDRVNLQRDSALFSSLRSTVTTSTDIRDSSVHEKISQFNSLAVQSKQLERRTADAALKRAMLGREEAENEMRRCRDEVRALRRQVEEGKERERRVGERLETVMENYGRAKETHGHTQALWEKEIRRARKEAFKSQSVIVKLQEELKSARSAQKTTEEGLDREKERSRAREQEAFQARYSLVGLQEVLDQALERVKIVEQERDALKTLARNEEDVARIEAHSRLPLPTSETPADGEPASRKKLRVSSISLADVKSSASSEAEIEELTRLWQWEKQRADRAAEHVEYLQTECQLRCCPCAKLHLRSSIITAVSARRGKRPEPLKIADAGDLAVLSEKAVAELVPAPATSESPNKSKTERLKEETTTTRRSTIFVPTEGIFRTVSQAEADELAAAQATEATIEEGSEEPSSAEPPTPADPLANHPLYARTPSVEPPAFAILDGPRTSLLSLLEAPHQQESHAVVFTVPTTPGPAMPVTVQPIDPAPEAHPTEQQQLATNGDDLQGNDTLRAKPQPPQHQQPPPSLDPPERFSRPHTAAAFYTVATTTTKVPLRGENTDPSLASRILALQRTPSNASSGGQKAKTPAGPSFDCTNPALTPTMTREQALAQIRERRGRARSMEKGGAVTPRKQMVEGVGVSERRDVSAPAGRVGVGRRVRS